jgi:hypothetical protein
MHRENCLENWEIDLLAKSFYVQNVWIALLQERVTKSADMQTSMLHQLFALVESLC